MPKLVNFTKIKAAQIRKAIKSGSIIIYPTDTIYGIGCDATNADAVKRLREIKKRTAKPFSIIAPSKQWIYKNLYANPSYIKKLPGPFTYLMKIKKRIVCKEASNSELLGVRIPDHRITPLIQKSGVPFITTSVNISKKDYITSITEIPDDIYKNVDLIIDGGPLNNRPSTVIDISGKIARIIR